MGPINSTPWSYVISIGQGYLAIHVVSNKFTIVVYFLSSYCVISNHPIIWSTIIIYFNINFGLTFIRIFYGNTKPKQIFFQGIYSPNLGDNLPHFVLIFLLHWHGSHFFYSLWRVFLITGRCKFWLIIDSVWSSPGWRGYIWCHCISYLQSICVIIILSCTIQVS